MYRGVELNGWRYGDDCVRRGPDGSHLCTYIYPTVGLISLRLRLSPFYLPHNGCAFLFPYRVLHNLVQY